MKAEIQFEAGRWYLLTLSYSPQGTALYVNAQLAAEGSGLPVVDPALAGLVVGSDLSGGNLAGGLCDEVTTFGQPATPEDQAAYFNAVSGQAALGPISAAEEEAALKAAEAWQAEQEAGMMRFAYSEPADPCVTNGPVYLTNIVAVLDTNQSWTGRVMDFFSYTKTSLRPQELMNRMPPQGKVATSSSSTKRRSPVSALASGSNSRRACLVPFGMITALAIGLPSLPVLSSA